MPSEIDDLRAEVDRRARREIRLFDDRYQLEAEIERLQAKLTVTTGELAWQQGEAVRLRVALRHVRELVDQQAEDEGLWFVAETAAEAYVQQELRKLHAAVEDCGTADLLARFANDKPS